MPGGTFLFVLSDFLASPPADTWLDAIGHGWDVVPVVIQDPVWERSWRDVGGVAVPVVDPRGGGVEFVRMSRREVGPEKLLCTFVPRARDGIGCSDPACDLEE
jgi:hypothetical protein